MADKSSKCTQYFAAIAAAVGAMAFGTGMAWTAPAGPKLIKGNEYGFEITDEQFSWVGSAMTVGAGSVCILTGYLINFMGRIFGSLVAFCPESPTYLMQRNKLDDATKALIWLRGKRYDPSIELSDMQIAIREQKAISESAVVAMLRSSSVKALSISFGLFICQQMCGINVVIFYTTDIFESANTPLTPDLSTALVGIVQVFATFLSVVIVDRLGRRILLLTSQLIVIICTFSLGYYFYMKDSDTGSVDHLSWLPVTSLCMFIIAFSLGLGPVPWVMLGEIFAPDIKGLAGSISATSNWTLAFIVTKTYNDLREAIGVGGTFWLFTGISLLGVGFIYFAVPETKGKSLNSIQRMLNKGGNVQGNSSGFAEQLLKNVHNNHQEMIALSNSKPFAV